MILHTNQPLDQILWQPNTSVYEYRQLHNSYIEGVQNGGEFTVSRLISTDPHMYLDSRFAPGRTLGDPGDRSPKGDGI